MHSPYNKFEADRHNMASLIVTLHMLGIIPTLDIDRLGVSLWERASNYVISRKSFKYHYGWGY